MKALRFDSDQRFSCRRCGRCCRGGWDIVLTPGEVEAYRRANVGRLWSAEGAEGEPFEPVPGHRDTWRLAKRPDGSCGFLSAEGLCRIHQDQGASRKPLACRMFPFQLHPAEGPPLLTASFSCPTVVANAGAPLGDQIADLSTLRKEWQSAWPEPSLPLEWVSDAPVTGATAGTIRALLQRLLDRPGPGGGAPDLRANVARIADRLEDWTRHRVLKLEPAAFAEYVELTGRHAAEIDAVVPARHPSAVGRWLARGFLLAVVAARVQARAPRTGPRWRLRARLLKVALHLHGLWPSTEGVSLAAARHVRFDLQDSHLLAIVRHYLRSRLATLPTGRRPMVDELAFSFATLNAASALAAMRAAAEGRDLLNAADFTAGLTEAADLGHAEGVALGRLLGALTGGLDALHAFASGAAMA
jgi:Fe-S-cluster containining protein